MNAPDSKNMSHKKRKLSIIPENDKENVEEFKQTPKKRETNLKATE
jgi:hypothetical protein